MGVGRGVVGRGVTALAVLGPALLALGVAGLVPPLRGLDAPPPAFRFVAVPWLLPGAWLTYRACAAFRGAWRAAEQAGPPRATIRHALLGRYGRFYLKYPPWSRPVLREWAIGLSGLFQAAAAGVALLLGLIGGWLGLSGEEGPGELLTSAALVVASVWLCVTGVRRYGRRSDPRWGMEAKRVEASVRLHRRLETLTVCGIALTWLTVGQLILALDLAG